MPIVDTVRFIPQKTVNESFGTLGFDEGYKSPDSEIVWGAVHVLATRKLGALPTPLQTSLDATVSLIAHLTPGTQAGCILTEITFCSQMTPTAHQTAIRDTIYKRLFVHTDVPLFYSPSKDAIATSLILSIVSILILSSTYSITRLSFPAQVTAPKTKLTRTKG